MLIIGLMSGTSADGIDAALIDIHGSGRRIAATLLAFECSPHGFDLRQAILTACDPRRGRIPELTALHSHLGERFAQAARTVAESAGVSLSDVRAIASHGQTIWHQPEPLNIAGSTGRGSLQIGNPAIIAAKTGCTVVSDFRSADMAAGGQGAPLVPFADWALFTSGRESRAIQNIGGIANVTHLPRSASLDRVTAFDTGPGNMVIGGIICRLTRGEKTYDEGGEWAARGIVHPELLARLMEHPYFEQNPPKSTGREVFGEQYVSSLLTLARLRRLTDSDLIATATALTAESVARAYRRWLSPDFPRTVILGGGGSHNVTLVRMLGQRLPESRFTNHASFGIPDDAKEAIAFAILGYETLRGRPSNVPTATGARGSAILGSITPPPFSRE
jgi:anhydro-N-acetylmuramic acid kinase